MSTSRLTAALNTPRPRSRRTPLQHTEEYAGTVIIDMTLVEGLMCLLHCAGLRSIANNAYLQMLFLLFLIDPGLSVWLRRNFTQQTAEHTPSATQDLRATFICNTIGYLAAAICIAACATDDVHSGHGDMLHVRPMHSLVALGVALGLHWLHDIGLTSTIFNLFPRLRSQTAQEGQHLINGDSEIATHKASPL